jgi:hypothetical protein
MVEWKTIPNKLSLTQARRTKSNIYLRRALFAFVGACENIQRQGDATGSGVFLWTLINVNSPQIDVDA